MLTYAVIVFAVAAVGGLFLALRVLGGSLAPWGLSLLHAGLGALGLVLVLLGILNGAGGGLVMPALVILVIAALGGFYLASIHLKGEVAPKGTVMVHAGAAVVGFLLLAGSVFGLI